MSENSSDSRPPLLRRSLSVVGWVALTAASFIGANLLFFALIWVAGVFGVTFDFESTVFNLVGAVIIYALFAGLLILTPLAVVKLKTTWADLGFSRWISWKDIVVVPAAFIGYFVLSTILVSLMTMVPGFDVEQKQALGFEHMSGTSEYVIAFFALVVLAPIVEEVLFRGLLQTRIKRFIGSVGAVVVVAAMFGAVHMQPNVMVDTFAMGLVAAILREYTGGVWASILLHMSKNGLAFYLLFINPSLLR